MTTLHAQPYDTSAIGFYFDSFADYQAKASSLLNSYGDPVEEFEIQFIDGDGIDCELFGALSVHQGSIGDYFNAVDEWSREDKTKVIIAVADGGYQFDLSRDTPDRFEIEIYGYDTMRELAEQFVDDGMFGEIPSALQNYIDVDAIAYDLAMDYSQTTVDGAGFIYRCA